jgi:glycosyltransferase involved in cell wall biosynthesis
MNIAFVTVGIYPYRTGGAEVFNYYLIKKLSQKYGIYLVTWDAGRSDLDVYILGRHKLKRFISRKFSFLPFQIFLTLWRLKREISLVHVTFMVGMRWYCWAVYPIFKKLFNINYVITVHDDGLLKEWVFDLAYQYFFGNSCAIIGVSEAVVNEYQSRIKNNVVYLPPLTPVNLSNDNKEVARVKFGLGKDDLVVLCVGRLVQRKGQSKLVEAFALLGKDYIIRYGLKLVLAGDGNMKPRLKQLIKKKDLNDFVFMLGTVPQEKLSGLYRSADIYAISSSAEGLSVALIEAAFNSLAVIAADSQSVHSLLQDRLNCLLFHPEDVNSLKENLKSLVEDPEKRIELGKNIKAFYDSHFSFECMCDDYSKIFTRCAYPVRSES